MSGEPTGRAQPRMGFEHLAGEQQGRLGAALWDAHAAAAKLVEFTAGHDLDDAATRTALAPAAGLLLPLLADALREIERIAPEEFAQLSCAGGAIEAAGLPVEDAAVWRCIASELPGLAAALNERLDLWHQG